MNYQLSQSYFFPFSIVVLCFCSLPSNAQIVPDSTLGSQITTQDNTIQIDGGIQPENGINLFHSFQSFSVSAGNTAYFNNDLIIQNIFARITGNSISEIDGIIKANGSANLFLINPNGIIFGKDASLDIGGSFLATTAEKVVFSDGTEFSTSNITKTPLLTISVPIGLSFGETVGRITNRASLLQVSNSKTLALVGGELNIGEVNKERSYSSSLVAEDGRIELGSVGNGDHIDLKQNNNILELIYQPNNINNWQNIHLDSTAFYLLFLDDRSQLQADFFTRAIQIQGGEINIRNSSIVSNSNSLNDVNILNINASKLINLLESTELFVGSSSDSNNSSLLNVNTDILTVENTSGINSKTDSANNAGDINLVVEKLIVSEGSQISSLTAGKGNGGIININATNSILLSGEALTSLEMGQLSGIFVSAIGNATGNAGKLTINTGELIVENIARISANNFGSGNGGEAIINVDNLVVRDGGSIEAGTFADGSGGNLRVNATNSIEVSGSRTIFDGLVKSRISTQSGEQQLFQSSGRGIAGELTISTPQLIVKDGAEINVSAIGKGTRGNLSINADSILIENNSSFKASSEFGDAGNIIIFSKNLFLNNESNIVSDAFAVANGGNVNIDSDFITASNNSNITANAILGQGGQINIKSQKVFLDSDSDITANSGSGLNGNVIINTLNIDPTQGLLIVPPKLVDATSQISQACNKNRDEETASSFIVTGRGGIPNTPLEPLTETTIFADWIYLPNEKIIEDNPEETPQLSNEIKTYTQIIEAQGWVVDARGKITLVNKDDRPHNYNQNMANNCDK